MQAWKKLFQRRSF